MSKLMGLNQWGLQIHRFIIFKVFFLFRISNNEELLSLEYLVQILARASSTPTNRKDFSLEDFLYVLYIQIRTNNVMDWPLLILKISVTSLSIFKKILH